MKVALVHDWLVTYRGGEKVLEAIAELYPEADLFTLIHQRGSVPQTLESRRIQTSFLQHVPGIHARYRHFLPLFPAAIRGLDLDGYDLVISSSHCVAKGVKLAPGARHLSYVHAPMRYMWDLFDDYFGPGRAGRVTRLAARMARPFLQRWDVASNAGVHRFVANSQHIGSKIQRLYGREAAVIHPPVELDRFVQQPVEQSGQGGYFLWLGALAPYKRVDLAIEAFRRTGQTLYIAGSGQDLARVRGGLPPNVKWLGQVGDEEVVKLYREARALVFTGEEDFGLTPLEAQASGRPVIALAKGGALETVSARTGLFFAEQTVESLVATLEAFDRFEAGFRPADARENALRFSKASFQRRLQEEVAALLGSDTGVAPPTGRGDVAA